MVFSWWARCRVAIFSLSLFLVGLLVSSSLLAAPSPSSPVKRSPKATRISGKKVSPTQTRAVTKRGVKNRGGGLKSRYGVRTIQLPLPPTVPTPRPTPRPTPTNTPIPTPTPLPTPIPTATPLPLRMVPFALPPFDSSRTATDVSWLNDAPAGRTGFVSTKGEHFIDGSGRKLRLWGVNLNFAGVFPSKEEAPLIAARLAKFGFNSVRLHHFEGYAAPNGLWKAAATGSSRLAIPRVIDGTQLDRFDFFAAQLIKRGLYLNINLHVGRKVLDGEGVPNAALLPEKDKGVNYFDAKLRDLQFSFAKTLLSHINPYTGKSYVQEPGVCAIEINNENSLLGMWLDGSLHASGGDTLQVLAARWNAWLKQKYSEVGLRRAWTEIDEPLRAANLLAGELPFEVVNPNAPDALIAISSKTLEGNFQLATVTGAQGTLSFDRSSGPTVDSFVRPGLTANLQTAGTVSWAFQINRDGLDLQEGHPYTLKFWARADRPRAISVNLWQDRLPRRFGGFTGNANLTSDWQQFSFTFRPSNPDPGHSRLSWNLGNALGTVQLGEIELMEGGRIAAPENWTLERGIPLLEFKSTQVLIARRDFAQFLGSIETEHLQAHRKYLQDLGVRVPIWNTQAQFGGWGGLVREMASDAIDVHAYWKHPDFGGAGWNGTAWKVDNQSMTSAAGIDPLSAFSLMRVPGKPFVMSEWNSGQPNDFGSESIPMVAAFAAWHDWAGVWLFDYHSAGSYSRDFYEGFFSIDSHPVKMATTVTSALLYRRPAPNATSPLGTATIGDLQIADAEDSVTLSIPTDSLWLEVATAPGPPTAAPIVKTWTQAGAARSQPLQGRTYVRIEDGIFAQSSQARWDDETQLSSATRQVNWDKARSLWSVNTPRTKIVAGFLGGNSIELDEWRIQMPRSQNNFATWSISSLDGSDIADSRRLLLTVAGRAENVNMGWNAARNSVGSQWGRGPTQIEAITGNIELLTSQANWQVWALDSSGNRLNRIAKTQRNTVLRFSCTPEAQTLWYEIVAS